jgi:hypothetical protein
MTVNQTNKLFTVEEANASLPLVRAITSDLAELSSRVFQRQRHFDSVSAGRELSTEEGLYSEELIHEQSELEHQKDKLNELIDELRDLGAEPKTGPSGMIDLVDFPSQRDERVVYLCWKLGEDRVEHWHELDTGFSGRQSLADGVETPVVDTPS